MKLINLQLQNFRNYSEQSVKFSKNLNIFLGNNAQGKTNLLESIYLLAFARSHRAYKDKELIKNGEKMAKIEANLERQTGNVTLELELSAKGKKTKVNHLEQGRLSNYLGRLNVVLFAPEDLNLIKGTPSMRRKFIDMELGQIKPLYLHNLVEYQKVLNQRNYYLKSSHIDSMMLDVFDEQLVNHGVVILRERKQFINQLEKIAQSLHCDISSQRENLTMRYGTFLDLDVSFDEVAAEFKNILQTNRKRDIEQRMTSKGPHRDDLLLEINNLDVKKFGSQGQQRLAALSLKLSEVELIRQEIGEYPILLLDDVMSELDNHRQLQLMKVIENKVQTFITTTTLDHLHIQEELDPDIFYINGGQIEERDDGNDRG